MLNKRALLESIKVKDRLDRKFSNITVEYFNSLPEKKKLYISVQYINEVNRLHHDILLREFIDANSIANWFTNSSLGSGFGQTILEYIIKFILDKLGIKNGFIVKTITNYLLDDPAMVIKSFTDCKIMTEKLVEALIETIMQMFVQNKVFNVGFLGDNVGGVLRNTVMEMFQNADWQNKLFETFTPVICKAKDEIFKNIKNKYFG